MRRELGRWSYVDRGGRATDTVLLAGSGRSGTTWLGEIIDRHHDHRVIFEPFKPDAVTLARPFRAGLYLRPGVDDPTYLIPAARIFSGALRSRWADHQNHARLVRRRLVKEVRINNLLPWISDAFPELRLVYLVRHPVAVADSARRTGWRDQPDLDALLDQPALVEDHLAESVDVLSGLRTPWERLIGQWCGENLAPLRMLDPDRACLVFYEELCDRSAPVAEEVLAHLGQRPDGALDEARRRPSRTATPDSAVVQGEDLVGGWGPSVSSEELERAVEIVDACGLGEVWGASPYPDVEAGRTLFARRWTSFRGQGAPPTAAEPDL